MPPAASRYVVHHGSDRLSMHIFVVPVNEIYPFKPAKVILYNRPSNIF